MRSTYAEVHLSMEASGYPTSLGGLQSEAMYSFISNVEGACEVSSDGEACSFELADPVGEGNLSSSIGSIFPSRLDSLEARIISVISKHTTVRQPLLHSKTSGAEIGRTYIS
jgi:hypothetical protein